MHLEAPQVWFPARGEDGGRVLDLPHRNARRRGAPPLRHRLGIGLGEQLALHRQGAVR